MKLKAIFLAAICMTSDVFAQDTDAAAMLPLQNYIHAHETGNADFIRRAFTSDAKIVGYMGGNLISWSVEQYAGRFSGKPASDESQRKRSFEIIDLTVNTAVGKVVLDYPTIKFVDYMTLLKIGGEWKIVNKSFNGQSKPLPHK